jgi:hypothetical protein
VGFNSAFKGLKSDTNNGYFTRRPVHNFDNISLNFVRMRKVSDKVCTENKKHTFYVQQLLFENRVVYEITWKNIVEPNRPQMTIWRKRVACWITNATNTHSGYVTLIAVPLQQWLHESA